MGKKILIVDDEVDIVELLKEKLSSLGYEIVAAYDGEDALAKVQKEVPDLVILDIMLPKINGYKVCDTLRNNYKYEAHKNIPIIMLTGRYKEVEDISAGLKLGVEAYLQKPIRVDLLVGVVQGLIKK